MAKNLAEMIKSIAAKTAPSMIPGPREPRGDEIPAPPEVDELPNLETLILDRKVRVEMEKLVERHGELGQMLSPLNKERKGLTDKIKKLAGTFGVGKAVSGLWRINYYNTPQKKLDQKKLMQALMDLGVPMATIKQALTAATTEKPRYTLKVTAVGESEESEEENAA